MPPRKPLYRRPKRKRLKKTTSTKRKPSSSKKKGVSFWHRALSFLGKAAVLAMIWGGVFIGALVSWYAYDMPDISQVTKPQRRPSITLLANDGTVFARYGDLYGQRVTGFDVPLDLVHAILAVEDRRFYSHFGIDVFGLARAFISNVRAGHVVQGGSTITQQLAKNLFLTPERTARRKVQEMLLAFWLEHTYSKEQILSAYLNRVYLGAGAYGVDAAADVYFGKPINALNLQESAILAGLLRAPSRFSPTNNPELAKKRMRTVLKAMQDAGYISEHQRARALLDTPFPRRKPGATGDGRYFADWIVDQVGSILKNLPQDVTVLTSLDLGLQRVAERKLENLLAEQGKTKKVGQGALISMTRDGAVRTMVGGRDYSKSQFNRAVQAKRQPGSSFKPIIYLAAIRNGLLPEDVFEDAPIKVGKWQPRNYSGKYKGPVTARQALAESINSVAVRVMQRAGAYNVVKTARALGVTSDLARDLSLALGTNSVSLLEMTGVYAAFAAGGRAITPFGIKEIRGRDGRILYRREAVQLPLTIEPQAVATLVDMMRDVVRKGTGRRALLDRPVAGKTGTSSEYRDAWFLGFTGNYVTGVWFGNDDNKPMKKVSGGNLPAMLWHDFMVTAEKKMPARDLLSELPPAPNALEEWSSQPPEKTGVDRLGDFIRSLTKGDVEVEPSYPN